jgi:hypothetical protein
MSPWNRRALRIPPDSLDSWIRLAIWELWMGMLVSVILGFGTLLVVSASDRVIAVSDFSNCYGPPPIALPCERIVYRGGALYAVFSALCGALLIGVALWLLWELWSAVEPKPITDDFLRLLNDSFGRDWRNPLTWPWARVIWAYGFTVAGAALTAGTVMMLWSVIVPSEPARPPTVHIETSQSFRLGR